MVCDKGDKFGMTKFKFAIIAITFLGLNLIFYPYVIEYAYKPMYNLAHTIVPDMPEFHDFIWRIIPWGVLAIIFLIAILIALGKAKNPFGGDDDDDGGEGDGDE